MTTEPPKGLRANLLRMYNTISDESYVQCKSAGKYQKLVFALSYFHSVLLERRKFRTLGLNIPYDFNDTDFSVRWGHSDGCEQGKGGDAPYPLHGSYLSSLICHATQ